MSESPKDEITQSPRGNQQFRPTNRQRPKPGVSKAIHNFGVPDLRDLLNQKHQNGQGQGRQQTRGSGPPPDPSYNFLKDPEREQHEERSPRGRHNGPRENHPRNNNTEWPPQKSGSFRRHHPQRSPRNPDSDKTPNNIPENPKNEAKPHSRRGNLRGGRPPRNARGENARQIENPVNIKVELSTSTGHRNCTIDESTILPNIKHVPEHGEREKRAPSNFSREMRRDRGRGGPGRFANRKFTGRVKDNNENEPNKEQTVEDKLAGLDIQDETFGEDDGNEGSEEQDQFEDSVQENVSITASSEDNDTERRVQIPLNEGTENEVPKEKEAAHDLENNIAGQC